MPSPRAAYGRNYTASAQIEIDAKNRDEAAYARERRRGDSGPFRGKPRMIRNDLPFKPYRYRGTGHDTMECTCHA